MSDAAPRRAADSAAAQLRVDVWSDIMCPFCYLGDTLLTQALDQFPHRQSVEIIYHSYQLMPDLPADVGVDLTALLVRERGFPREQAEAMNAQIAQRGAEVGLAYRFEISQATNTRTAHRLSHFARRHGLQHEMIQRLFSAYFAEGLLISDPDVLTRLAVEVGLDADAARTSLDSDEYEAAVAGDIAQAAQLGLSGVPFFVFDGRYVVSGAQPVEAFLQTLNAAWDARFASDAVSAS